MADGLYQSAILFFIPFLAYGQAATWSSSGRDTASLYDLGTTIAVAGVFIANLYVGINTRYWTIITWIIYVASTLLVVIWIPIYSSLAGFPYTGEVQIVYSTFQFWFIIFFTIFCACGPRWLALAIRQSYFPRDKDIIREAWVAGNLKDELGIQHRRRKPKVTLAHPTLSHPSSPEIFPINTDLESHQSVRGEGYEPANTFSPQRDRTRSPLMSDAGTPRGPFSYPPSPSHAPAPALISPTIRPNATISPPLIRGDSDKGSEYHADKGESTPTQGIPLLSYSTPRTSENYGHGFNSSGGSSDRADRVRASLSIPARDDRRQSRSSVYFSPQAQVQPHTQVQPHAQGGGTTSPPGRNGAASPAQSERSEWEEIAELRASAGSRSGYAM